VKDNELFFNYQVYNQAIVVPETIDAIRALTGIEEDGLKSISKTDAAMGVMREFIVRHPIT
jgi:glyceraldehyde-3-phosphate dehydrogenase (NAD(P))